MSADRLAPASARRGLRSGLGSDALTGRLSSRQLAAGPPASLPPFVLLDLHVQPLDLLVERRERDAKAVGGFSLAPAAFFQHVADDAALAVFDDLEQRGLGRA